jgi:hypothetical protein
MIENYHQHYIAKSTANSCKCDICTAIGRLCPEERVGLDGLFSNAPPSPGRPDTNY